MGFMNVIGAALVVCLVAVSGEAVDARVMTEAAPAYDPSQALAFVYASAIAYCPSDSIINWTCAPCKNLTGAKPLGYAYNSTLNVAAYVADLGNGVGLVSFRGTDPSSLKNWIADLYASKATPLVGCSGCLVHQGFHLSFLELRPQINALLQSMSSSLKSIVVTGHSLGAAIAALAAWDFNFNQQVPVDVFYTFGQPRVGNAAFATSFGSAPIDEYRVVHYKDIVPHLPTESMGFHHVKTEVWYQENNTEYKVCDGSGEDDSCSDSFLLPDSVSDHLDYLNVRISDLC